MHYNMDNRPAKKTTSQKVISLILSGLIATTFSAGTQISQNIPSYNKTAANTLTEDMRNKLIEENNDLSK